METRDPDEETRLLDPEPPASQSPGSKPSSGPGFWQTILSATAVLFILEIGNQLSLAPSTAILEATVCQKYYAAIDGHLGDCKAEPIQSEVAYILGWKDVFENLPAILLAVPFGALADKIGRRKIMILATAGLVLNDTWIRLVLCFSHFIPLRLLWLSGLWQMIGAGVATLSSIVYAQVSDVCPAEQRTTAFSFIQSAGLVSRVVFLPVGAGLMSIDPWIPMVTTSGLGVLSFLVALLLVPETLQLDKQSSDERGDTEQLLGARSNGQDKVGLHPRLKILISRAVDLNHWIMGNARVVCLLICLFTFYLGQQSDGTILLQYASKRLHWTLGQASLLLSLRAGVTLVLLAVILPALSSFLLIRLDLHESIKDKRLTQACGVLLAAGSSIIFFATSWEALLVGQFLFSAGCVFGVPARSLAAGMVDQKHVGVLFTVVSVAMQGGFIAGGPILATAFKWGMKLGDFWMGMPFLVALICFIVGTLSISAVTTKIQISNGDAGIEIEN
ncbi:hypothetical protein PFICI_11237 [Pestalotiopsis fici W106-1]|uniref:Major facilitator superfamily (MFS) profile domain-containing protein n=1 Tax=Pestalotiopsis fici (strain W106-1 / CGMCC3.15140) TaxID=1229662 RepID=W3WU10_PESFW|nr:uncharacterized protein PFICI_11237 [Pestalotiopsis fici W106-1]ETS77363.1 hypothetical protein PFICI_11237 [Pestalotiopsis fici W106-1]